MLAIRIGPKLEDRLNRLAKLTGRSKTFYTRETIEEHTEDMEDYYLTVDAIRERGRSYSAEEAKRELDLSD